MAKLAMENIVIWRCIFLVVAVPKLAIALYEDQVGLFDWQKHLTGVPYHIVNAPSSQNVIFGTDRTAIAAVDVNTGELAWRRALESGDAEVNHEHRNPAIDAMWLTGHGGRSVAVLTLGGRALRVFDTENGKLKLELSLVAETPAASNRLNNSCVCCSALHLITDAVKSEVVIAGGNGVISKLSLSTTGNVQTLMRWRCETFAFQYWPVFMARRSPTTVVLLLAPRGNADSSALEPAKGHALLVELDVDTGAVLKNVAVSLSSAPFNDFECTLMGSNMLLCVSRSTFEALLLQTTDGKIISTGKTIDAVFGTKCGFDKTSAFVNKEVRRRYLQCVGDDCKAIVFTCSNEAPGTYILRANAAGDEGVNCAAEVLDPPTATAFIVRRPVAAVDDSSAFNDIILTAVVDGDDFVLNSVPVSQILSSSSGKDMIASQLTVSYAAAYGAPKTIYVWQTVKLGVKQQYYVVATKLDVVLLFRGAELVWARHEGLASIVSSAITELPQTASENIVENEFFENDAGANTDAAQLRRNAWMPQSIVHAFARRLFSQCLQLKHFILHFQNHVTSLLSTQILPSGIVGGGQNRRTLSSRVPNFKIGTAPNEKDAAKSLERNQFDTHKLIVAATRSGALYGLETKHGNIVWFNSVSSKQLRCITNNDHTSKWQRTEPDCKFHLFVQRINAPKPYSTKNVAMIVGETGNPSAAVGAWLQFDPITGQFITPHAQKLPAAVSSIGLLPIRIPAEHLQLVFVLDAAFGVHVLPPTAALLADNTSHLHQFIRNDLFLSTIHQPVPPNGPLLVAGCKPQIRDDIDIFCAPLWSHELGSADRLPHVIAVVSKSPLEVAYSDARIIADEKLLYKYINPNLLLIITEISSDASSDVNSEDKLSLNSGTPTDLETTALQVLCIDIVTGQVIVNNVHKRASGPVAAVLSENFIVYTYWNERMRNTDVAVLDFYLGERKLVSTGDEYERAFVNGDDFASDPHADNVPHADDYFAVIKNERNVTAVASYLTSSSLSPWLSSLLLADYLPIIEQRVYSLRAHVRALGVSQTVRGITHKSIYFALSNGAVLELPKMVVDARRPVIIDNKAREEGLAPYVPELPLAVQQYVNYNRSTGQIAQLHCAPAGLESTALLFVTGGLDLFFTQLAPSQRFDVLKDDFDYWMIIVALTALIAASLISRRIAHRKVLLEVWK